MKFHFLIISLLSLSLSLTAQNSAENDNTPKEKVQVPEIITKLNVLDQVVVDEYILIFKSVESDGRCPEKVTCVWPGEANVVIEIFDGTETSSETVAIPAMGFQKEIFTTSKHIVYLKNLTPYPITAEDKIKAYELLLKVHPKKL